MSIDFTPLEFVALIVGVGLLLLAIFKRRQFAKFVFSVFHALGELCRRVEDMLDLVGKWCSKTVLGILMWGRKETPAHPAQFADETESGTLTQEDTTGEGSVVLTFLFPLLSFLMSAPVLLSDFA